MHAAEARGGEKERRGKREKRGGEQRSAVFVVAWEGSGGKRRGGGGWRRQRERSKTTLLLLLGPQGVGGQSQLPFQVYTLFLTSKVIADDINIFYPQTLTFYVGCREALLREFENSMLQLFSL